MPGKVPIIFTLCKLSAIVDFWKSKISLDYYTLHSRIFKQANPLTKKVSLSFWVVYSFYKEQRLRFAASKFFTRNLFERWGLTYVTPAEQKR